MLGKTRGPTHRLAGMAAVVLVTGLGVLGATSQVWGTSVIDFEDWTGGGDVQPIVQSGGFTFGNGFIVSVAPQTGNDTYALHGILSDGKFWKGGDLFSVTSLDLQEGLAGTTVFVKLIGHRSSLPSVVQAFTLDGYPDTFETLHPVGFSDLDMFTIYAYDAQGRLSPGFSIDNIVIPEPSVLGLIMLSLGVLTRRRTCR